MADAPTPPKAPNPLGSAKLFNEFQAQSRARLEAGIKLIMLLSGGMLTLSVGAILGNSGSKIPPDLIGRLAYSWLCFFYSIAAGVVLLAGMVAATFHMSTRWRKGMQAASGVFFVATWPWLRVLNTTVGISAALSFLVGLVFISQVAIGVAHAAGAPIAVVKEKTQANGVASNDARTAAAAIDSRGNSESKTEPPPIPVTIVPSKQTLEEAKSAAAERSQKAELDRKLVDFNHDLAFYTALLAIIAGLQFLALLLQAFFLRRAFIEARRGGDIARLAMIAGERAFVFPMGYRSFYEPYGTTGLYSWRFRPVWRNSGDTPTRNMIMHTRCILRNDALPTEFDFDAEPQPTGTALLAPNSEALGGVVPPYPDLAISPQDLAAVMSGQKFLYIWGWAQYSDVFDGTEKHITRFCWSLAPIGDPLSDPSDPSNKKAMSWGWQMHTEGNCADDECASRPA
jgi:hypothetical protein